MVLNNKIATDFIDLSIVILVYPSLVWLNMRFFATSNESDSMFKLNFLMREVLALHCFEVPQ